MAKNDFYDNVLKKLTDEELLLLIKIIPQQLLIEISKKNNKTFKVDLKGFRPETKKSELPLIYFKKFREGNINIINLVIDLANKIVNDTSDKIFEETLDENFFEKSVESNNLNDFAFLVEKILLIRKPEELKLYFKLREYQLTASQNEYLEKELPKIVERKMEKEKIENALKNEYDNQILKLTNKFKEKIFILENNVKKLTVELKEKNNKLAKKENQLNALMKKKDEDKEIAKLNLLKYQNDNAVLKNEINKLNNDILNKEIKINDQKILNESLQEKLNLKNNEFTKLVEEQWEVKNIDLVLQNESLQEENMLLNNQKKELHSLIANLENKVQYWDGLVKDYVQNIDKSIIQNALDSSLLGVNIDCRNEIAATKINTNNSLSLTNFLYIKEDIKEEPAEICLLKEDFIYNIASNFEAINLAELADEMAIYIISILASGLVPLIYGYNAREIANGISTAYCGKTAYVVTLPNGYSNASELRGKFNQSNSDVVLIEDAIGTMNEYSLLPLLREKGTNDFNQKILLLSVENYDSIKYMPENLFNYVVLVSVENNFIFKKSEYIYSDAKEILKRFSSSICDSKEIFKKIKKLLKSLEFKKVYKKLRANVFAFYCELANFNEAVESYVRHELSLLSNLKGIDEQLEQNIVTYNQYFKPELLKLFGGEDDEY